MSSCSCIIMNKNGKITFVVFIYDHKMSDCLRGGTLIASIDHFWSCCTQGSMPYVHFWTKGVQPYVHFWTKGCLPWVQHGTSGQAALDTFLYPGQHALCTFLDQQGTSGLAALGTFLDKGLGALITRRYTSGLEALNYLEGILGFVFGSLGFEDVLVFQCTKSFIFLLASTIFMEEQNGNT